MGLPLRFKLLGRGFHPVISTADDLEKVAELDDAYWVCTAVPVASLRGDAKFYAALDIDGDGRIRSDELRTAVKWTLATLKDRAGVTAASDALALSAVDPAAADGPAILDAARKVSPSGTVSLAEVRAALAAEEAKGLSSAGRVLPAAAGDDAALRAFLEHVIEVTGGEPHPAGEPSVTKATMDAFLEQGKAWLAWAAAGKVPASGSSEVMPLGAATAAAHAAVEAIADKVAQYFILCDAVALDPDLAARAKVDPAGTDLLDPAQATALLVRAPLATPRADGVLAPAGPLNPAWRARIADVFEHAVTPLLGAGANLDRAGWDVVRGKLAPFGAWSAGKPATKAGDRGEDVAAAHTSDDTLVTRTDALLVASVTGAVAVDGLRAVEKLVLLQSRLVEFANNMVAMPQLFDTSVSALFEHGRLVLDGREFDLSVRVTDQGRAEKFGGMSPIFTMFVMVGDKGTAWTDQLAVPVTAGTRGHLTEGQWGVFFPTDGGELHAQIRKIAVSPISIWEALIAPFRRVGEALQSAADKAASEQQTSMSTRAETTASDAATRTSGAAASAVATGEAKATAAAAPPPAPDPSVPATPPPAPTAPPAGGGMAGQIPLLLAGAGVAFAAIGAVLTQIVSLVMQGAASLAEMITSLPLLRSLPDAAATLVQVAALPLSLFVLVLGLVLVPFLLYAIPIAVATWLRLRRRDLSTLLEGAGFAMNARMYLDRNHAVQLTRKPTVAPTDITR